MSPRAYTHPHHDLPQSYRLVYLLDDDDCAMPSQWRGLRLSEKRRKYNGDRDVLEMAEHVSFFFYISFSESMSF